MRNASIILFAAITAATALVSCKNEPKAADQGTPKPDTIHLTPPPSMEGARTFNITEGVVNWVGEKSVTSAYHTGTIAVKSGELKVNQGQLLAGNIVMDMNSIAVTDLKDPGEKADLESHLKDKDFFESKKYPEGVFTIDEILPSKTEAFNTVISGRLTLKGKTNTVNIPVKMTINGDELTAESPVFVINRTQWGINFQSTVLNTAKDKLISDNIPLRLNIKARAAAQ